MSRILSARSGRNHGLVASLEGLGDEEVVIADGEPVSSEMDQEHEELQEAAADVEEAHEVIDELEGSSEGLESIANLIQSTIPNGGMSPQSAMFMQHSVDKITTGLGYRRSLVPSFESFGRDSSRLSVSMEALEGIKATLVKIWEAIKKAVLAAWNAVKNFFDRLFNIVPRIKHAAEALKDKVKLVKGSPEGEIELGGLAAKIAIDGNVNAGVAGIEHAHTVIESLSNSVEKMYDSNETGLSKTSKDEKDEEIVKKLVAVSKEEAHAPAGFIAGKGGDNTEVFRSVVLPGDKQFVVTYRIAKESDSLASAAEAALAGPRLSLDGAKDVKGAAKEAKAKPLNQGEMEKVLDVVIKIADAGLAARSKIAAMQKAGEAALNVMKAAVAADETAHQGLASAALRAGGKRLTSAAKAPYEVWKYGAEVSRSFLILVEKSLKAHKVA